MRPRLMNWPLMRASRNPPRILFRERTSLCGCAIRQTGSRESTATGSRTTENGAWSRYRGMAFREGSSRSALDCPMQSMPPRMRDCGGCGCDGLNRRRGRHVGPRVNRRFEVRRGVRPRAGEQWNVERLRIVRGRGPPAAGSTPVNCSPGRRGNRPSARFWSSRFRCHRSGLRPASARRRLTWAQRVGSFFRNATRLAVDTPTKAAADDTFMSQAASTSRISLTARL